PREPRAQLLRQFVDRQRVIYAAVVPGNDVEVVQAEPVTQSGPGIHHEQRGDRSLVDRHRRQHPPLLELRYRELGLDADLQQNVDRAAVYFGRHGDRFSRAPAERFVVIGNAADCVRGTVDDVPFPVPVEVDRGVAVTAGQKLRYSHRARVRAPDPDRIEAGFTRQQQVLLELGPEQLGTRWKAEREYGERVEHPETSGIAPVERLHPDSRDDDFLGDSEFTARLLERGRMQTPEGNPVIDAHGFQVAAAELVPRTRSSGRGHCP